jgi:hypothetical protein
MDKQLKEKALKSLDKEYAGYVLITCKPPAEDGNMDIELHYKGDPVLVSYLAASAHMRIEEDENYADKVGSLSN